MVFMNTSQQVYTIIYNMSQTTGSFFLTLLMLIILIMVVFAIVGLSVEWSAIFIFPLLLVLMAYDAAFYPAGGAMLLYLAFLFAKNFFFTR
jgi:hypothetical protein